MNLEPSEDQRLIVETFRRFLKANSSSAQVRDALPTGFDAALWGGLAELGAFGMRVPEADGGLGLGIFEAALVMEEAGKALVSGPLAESMVAARLVAELAIGADRKLLKKILDGELVAVLALHDAIDQPQQWIGGGTVADVVIARFGDRVAVVEPGSTRHTEPNLGDQPMALLGFGHLDHRVVAEGPGAIAAFESAVEEWKVLLATALAGLAGEALRLACDYACERIQFDQPIGTFQSISHPLADLNVYVDGSKYAAWGAICAIAERSEHAAAQVSMALWLACDSSSRAVAQALHTFGGYGLTLEYDVHLFNLRAKAWPLVWGDPAELLEEAGRRLYQGEKVALPVAGDVPIDFEPGDDAVALANETRAFFEANLTPELRRKARYSTKGHDAGIHRKLAEAGLLFPSFPPELGGRNANPNAERASREVWAEFNWTG